MIQVIKPEVHNAETDEVCDWLLWVSPFSDGNVRALPVSGCWAEGGDGSERRRDDEGKRHVEK